MASLDMSVGYYSLRQHASGVSPSVTITPATGHEVLIYDIAATCDQAGQTLTVRNADGEDLYARATIGDERLSFSFGTHGLPCGSAVAVTVAVAASLSSGANLTVIYCTRSLG